MSKDTKVLRQEVTGLSNNLNGILFYAIVATLVLVGVFLYRNMVIYSVRGDMDVDNGTLYVDAAGNKVGVVNKTPSFPMDVMGDINTSTKIREGGFVLIPTGFIAMWTGTVAPNGWVLCDGSNGTPDLRGRFVLGQGQGTGLTNRILNSVGGTETHLLTALEIPTHTHTGTTTSDGTHTHTINDPGHTHSQTTINDDYNNSGANPPGFSADSAGSVTWNNINSSTTGISINSNGAHQHTFTTDSTGGGTAHNNMPPFYVLAYIMKI